MNLCQKTVIFFATGCYSGKIPFAPGTFGSLAALPACYLFSMLDSSLAALGILCLTGLAVGVAHIAEKLLNAKDPGCIVIDEMAGMMVTLFAIPFTPIAVGAGFLIFRTLDILKPFPIRVLERNLPGGAGIVLDDIAAGIYSHLILRGIFFLTGPG